MSTSTRANHGDVSPALAARLARTGAGGIKVPPLRIEEVLRYAIEVARALDAVRQPPPAAALKHRST